MSYFPPPSQDGNHLNSGNGWYRIGFVEAEGSANLINGIPHQECADSEYYPQGPYYGQGDGLVL
jgi:hypothetical protein